MTCPRCAQDEKVKAGKLVLKYEAQKVSHSLRCPKRKESK